MPNPQPVVFEAAVRFEHPDTGQLIVIPAGTYYPDDLETFVADPPTDPVAVVAPETLDELRTELFQHGSSFKPTYRHEIVGIDNILGEIEEIIHWLRHADAYDAYASRLQPGAIFAGSPGVGKTLVSRWIATESGARFINIREFVHDTALFTDRDIHELFSRARACYAETGVPIVLFWDEFENAAMERGGRGTTPEQRAVVSQLTAELDGVHGKNRGILLVGCTNYLSSIDQALMRRGRMGVQIEFYPPDRAGKEKILRYYLAKVTTADGLDINTLSYFFPKDNTAADIEEACVEAWRHAVRRSIDQGGEPIVANDDLIKVFIKQLVGPPTTFTIPEDEKLPIAIHESGHAIMALAYGVPLRLITVQPGKASLGRVIVDDVQEYVGTIAENLDHLRVGLGGIACERAVGLPAMVGVAQDIKRVSEEAAYLVDSLDAGARTGILNLCALERMTGYSYLNPQVSQSLLDASDQDVRDIVDMIERDAGSIMARVGKDDLLEISERVNERVTMTGHEFRDLFTGVCGCEPETLREDVP